MTAAIHDLPLFMAAALLLNLTPGPDMLFVVGSSAARGRAAGVMAALGIGAGCMVHIGLAALGLTALLATSALAFTVVKMVGAAYLVWMGLSLLRASGAAARQPTPAAVPRASQVFWQGALTNALNPKVALFFLAFLPQFIAPGATHQAWAFVALGLLFNASGTAVNVAVALLTSRLRSGLSATPVGSRVGAWLKRAAGALFIAMGLKLALDSK